MRRPAFIAELLKAAGKAAKLKYNVTCDKPEAAPFILLASPANILELEAGRIAARNEALEEAAKVADDEDQLFTVWGEDRNTRVSQETAKSIAKAIRALKSKENAHE